MSRMITVPARRTSEGALTASICQSETRVLEQCRSAGIEIALTHSADPQLQGLLALGACVWLAKGAGLDVAAVERVLAPQRGHAPMTLAMVEDMVRDMAGSRLVMDLTEAAARMPTYVPPHHGAHIVTTGGVA